MPAADDTAQPTSAGRSQYSDPSARARHASLVRWGKEQPMSFQERLAAIRAARAGRKKAGKGRAAKPKATPEQRAAEKQKQVAANRANVRQAMADADQGLAPKGFDNLMALGGGTEPDKMGADALVNMGLAERGGDGVLRLTAGGRQAIAAASRGDAKEAIDAISRAGDHAQAGRDREKAKETRAQERFAASAQRDMQRQARQQERAQLAKERQKEALARAKQSKAGRAKRQSRAEQDRAARDQNETPDTPPVPDGTLDKKERAAPDAPKPTPERAKPTPAELADAERAGAAAARGARRRSRRHQRRRMSTIVREAETKMSDRYTRIAALKAQTAQERAMFANMGRSKGGAGAGPGGKPTGGQGGLWPKGPDGKRHPEGEGGGAEKPASKHDLSTPEGRQSAILEKAGHPIGALPINESTANEFHGGRATVIHNLSKLSKEDLDTLEKDVHDKFTSLATTPSHWQTARERREYKVTRDYQKQIIKEARAKQKEKADDDLTLSLPQDLTKMTRAQHQAVVDKYSKMPLAELRRRQDLVRQQKQTAYQEYQRSGFSERNNRGMQNLDIQEQHLRAAIDKQVFCGGDKPKRAKKSIDEDTAMLDLDTAIDTLDDLAETLLTDAEAEVKAGRRNSAADQDKIQQVFELANELEEIAIALGADPGDDDDSDVADEGEGADEADMEGKAAIGKRADVNPKEGVSAYGDVRFADEKNKKYPIDTEAHIRSAWNYINNPDDAGKYSPDEVATIKKKIVAAWKDTIDPAGPPSAETKKDAAYMIDGDAVKALDNGLVGGYAVRFGDAETPDLSHMRDYFTKATDFWIDAWDKRPMLYHHAMDESTADAPRVGTWLKATVDDTGVWLEGQLDRAHKYHGAIKELIRRGALKLSSDSAPHLVQRARMGDTHEVKRWPLMACSLTPTPAEPRLAGVSFKGLLAELGLEDISDNPEATDDDAQRLDGAKADQERARKLSLELELLTLETTL